MARYLLEGTAAPEVFASLIRKPEDRADNARGLMERAGCKLIDYYIGVNNYKTYVIVDCPDSIPWRMSLTATSKTGTISPVGPFGSLPTASDDRVV